MEVKQHHPSNPNLGAKAGHLNARPMLYENYSYGNEIFMSKLFLVKNIVIKMSKLL